MAQALHARLQDKLNEVLGGLESATRRARVRALRVLHVTGARMSFSPGTQRPRCTGLDLDIEWSAEPLAPGGAPGSGGPRAAAVGGESLHGMARVKLQTAQGCDKVLVTDVQVLEDEEGADGAPCMPSGKAAPPDVLLAVQSLDGTIMEHLNAWMWEVEQAEAGKFPLSSFELDEETAALEGTLTQAPSFDAAALGAAAAKDEEEGASGTAAAA